MTAPMPETMNLEPGPLSDDFEQFGGCRNCDGSGWRHGCVGDLCQRPTENADCPYRIPCQICNAEGDR